MCAPCKSTMDCACTAVPSGASANRTSGIFVSSVSATNSPTTTPSSDLRTATRAEPRSNGESRSATPAAPLTSAGKSFRSTTHRSCSALSTALISSSVLQNLRALDHHVAGGLHVGLAAVVNQDVLALDQDRSVLFHRDAGLAGPDDDRLAGVDDQILLHGQRVVVVDGGGARL